MDNASFQKQVYGIIRLVPVGCVISYGVIAALAGRPQNARLVGKFVSEAPSDVPAHRTVNHAGRLAPHWPAQGLLLEREGVTFKENGCVNMKKHLWKPF